MRFTPYTYVMVDTDVVLNRDKIADFFEDDTEYLWGYFDGTGDEILMSPGSTTKGLSTPETLPVPLKWVITRSSATGTC